MLAGASERLQVLPLTHDRCNTHEDEAACWREVEEDWGIMLGGEGKHYEISAVTLLRNAERDRMFLREVEALKRDAGAADGAAAAEVAALKRQVALRPQRVTCDVCNSSNFEHDVSISRRSWGTSRNSRKSSAFCRQPRTKT
jgi:hypothetical protein